MIVVVVAIMAENNKRYVPGLRSALEMAPAAMLAAWTANYGTKDPADKALTAGLKVFFRDPKEVSSS